MELTPEQIAEFERRAAAGEKPKRRWDVRLKMGRMFVAQEFICFSTASSGDKKYALRDETAGQIVARDLDSMEAGQLAAENLLKEGVRPLFEAEINARTDEARDLYGEMMATAMHRAWIDGADFWTTCSVRGPEALPIMAERRDAACRRIADEVFAEYRQGDDGEKEAPAE